MGLPLMSGQISPGAKALLGVVRRVVWAVAVRDGPDQTKAPATTRIKNSLFISNLTLHATRQPRPATLTI
jgi:hypothetical protein